MENNIKICTICNISKNLNEFHNLKTGKFGKHSNCKNCRSQYRKNLCYKKPINGKLKCCKCHVIKDVIEFYAERSSSTGLQSCCKTCSKEKIYESQSKLIGYLTKIYNNLQIQSKKNKEIFEITKEDIIEIYNSQNKKCALSDEMLTYYSGPALTNNKYEYKYNLTISKKVLNRGYIKDNIQLVGYDIYKMKHNLDNNEFIRLCKLIIKNN